METQEFSYRERDVIEAISKALEDFYTSVIASMDKLNITKVMSRKNPYLYRAKAVSSAADIVDGVLSAFVSSSEETIFGNCFFEPLAIAASGGQKSIAEGIDLEIDSGTTRVAVAVKSGTSVFNADSKKRQEENFLAANKLARQAGKVLLVTVTDVKRNAGAAGRRKTGFLKSWPGKFSGSGLLAMRNFIKRLFDICATNLKNTSSDFMRVTIKLRID